MTDPATRTVTLYPYSPAGTWPGTEHLLKRFTPWETLDGVVHRFHSVKPVRHADAEVAGRPVYVLEFRPDQCNHPKSRGRRGSRLYDGRIVVWIDQETHFSLRADQYAWDRPEQVLLRWYVTEIDYNEVLDPDLFQVSVPPGYRLVEEQ